MVTRAVNKTDTLLDRHLSSQLWTASLNNQPTMTYSKRVYKETSSGDNKNSKNGDAALKINRYCCADDVYIKWQHRTFLHEMTSWSPLWK